MPTLVVNGARIQVSDEFLQLSDEEKQRTIEQIASQVNQSRSQAQRRAVDLESGSIADALGQGALFGFSDEIAGGLGAGVNSVANLFGAGTGESFGDAYKGIRDAARYNLEAYRQREPGKALAAEIGGGLLTGGYGAARSGALAGGNTLLRSGASGAGLGAAYGAGASKADLLEGEVGGLLKDTATGGAVGAAGGVLLPAAGQQISRRLRRGSQAVDDAVRPPGGLFDDVDAAVQQADDVAARTSSQSARYQDDVRRLREGGVDLTTGQRTGSETVKAYEGTLRNTVGGGSLNNTFDRQRQQFQERLLQMAGASDDLARTGQITDDVLDQLGDQLSARYRAALSDRTVNLGDDFVDGLARVEARHSRLVTSQQRREVRTLIDDFLEDATQGGISGQRYQQLRSLMGRRARQNQINNQPLADLFRDLQRSLDDAFTASVGSSNRHLNTQYAHFKQLQDLHRRLGGTEVAQGILPLSSLNRLAKQRPGSEEWRKFINAGAAVLQGTVPNSGTATRQSLLRTLGNVGTLGGLEGALLAGRFGTSQMLSRGAGAELPGLLSQGLQSAGRGVQQGANFGGVVGVPVSQVPGLLADPALPPL